jgi:hypothetical protein
VPHDARRHTRAATRTTPGRSCVRRSTSVCLQPGPRAPSSGVSGALAGRIGNPPGRPERGVGARRRRPYDSRT